MTINGVVWTKTNQEHHPDVQRKLESFNFSGVGLELEDDLTDVDWEVSSKERAGDNGGDR